MSKLFNQEHRDLQDEFDTRKLADRVEQVACSETVDTDNQIFIESRDMFFLATVDANGSPTVSYKGGDIGVVKVLDEKTLIFPSYDGNGMFLSMGNVVASGDIGMLFIDFETPRRLRVQANATISKDPSLMAHFPHANLVVKAQVKAVFQNCPRYIHPHQRIDQSIHTPKENNEPPMAAWKRIDGFQDVLPAEQAAKVADAGGVITTEEYVRQVNNPD